VQKGYAGPFHLEPVLDINLVKTEPYAPSASEFSASGVMPPPPEMDMDFNFDSDVFPQASEPFPPRTETFSPASETFPPRTETFPPASETFPPRTEAVASGSEVFPPLGAPLVAENKSADDWAKKSSIDFSFDLGDGQTTEPLSPVQALPDAVPERPARMTPTPIENLIETRHAGQPKGGQENLTDTDLIGSSYVPEDSSHGRTDFGPFTLPTDTIALGGSKKMPDVSLDLNQDANRQAGSAPRAAAIGKTSNWQEMATKIDLALAYRDIGDKKGALELLREVVQGGDAVQIQKAKALLASIH
jgi:FimV-like protein